MFDIFSEMRGKIKLRSHFEHRYVFQELREEGDKIGSNLANICGVRRVISHVAVPSTNGIVYKQNIGCLYL